MGAPPPASEPSRLRAWRVVALPSLVVVSLIWLFLRLAPPPHTPSDPLDALLGSLLLAYAALLLTARCSTLGWVYYCEVLWGCNTGLLMAGVGMVLNRPLLVGTSVCVVAVDQLCWYVDLLGYVALRRFPVGVAKYVADPSTTWIHRLTCTHHVWFLPLCIYWLGKKNGLPRDAFWGAVLATAVIAVAARVCTPFAIWIKAGKDGRFFGKVWNINLAYEFYRDVEIPPLHWFDHHPNPVAYLTFLIFVCNFVLNSLPCWVVYQWAAYWTTSWSENDLREPYDLLWPWSSMASRPGFLA